MRKGLRLNGYDASPSVFKNSEKDGEFFCYAGQSDEGATVIFNFYRATQVQSPGESVLDEGKNFAINFLSKKQDTNQILDKWIISKDLSGEENNSSGSYEGKTEIGEKMQELVQLVLSSNGMDLNMKKTFLTVTKSFYYVVHTDPHTVNSHIEKVLLEKSSEAA